MIKAAADHDDHVVRQVKQSPAPNNKRHLEKGANKRSSKRTTAKVVILSDYVESSFFYRYVLCIIDIIEEKTV